MAKNQTAVKTANETPETSPAETAAPVAKVAEPTSENLTKLRNDEMASMEAASNETDPNKKRELFMQTWKIGEDIKKELVEIKRNANELLEKEKRASKVKLVDDLLEADRAAQASIGNDRMSLEDKQSISDAFKTKYEDVVNKVLGSTRSAAPTGKSATSGNGRGATKQAILEIIAALYGEGKTGKEVRSYVIKEKGFNDGTANAVIKEYEVENGIGA